MNSNLIKQNEGGRQCKNIMDRSILINFFASLLLICSVTGLAIAQQNEIDTLYYFCPDSLDLNPVFTGDVENAGVYFTPDSTWPAYDILQVHLLFLPTVDSVSSLVSLHKDETMQQPGDTLLSIPLFKALDADERYPNWMVIDLSGRNNAKNRNGNFWLVSNQLFLCVGSRESSQHSFTFSANTSKWGRTEWDFAARVVIREISATTGIDHQASDDFINDQIIIQNHPNPFNASTNIHLQTQAEKGDCAIHILNIKGQIIRTLFKGTLMAGEHRFNWNGKDSSFLPVPSGLYFIQLVTGRQTSYTKKLLVVR